MRVPVKIKASLDTLEKWRRFVPPPPNELLFDNRELQFGQWIIEYNKALEWEISDYGDELEFKFNFPIEVIDKLRETKIFMSELIIDKRTLETTVELKPLDHIHLVLKKEDGIKLLGMLKNKGILL